MKMPRSLSLVLLYFTTLFGLVRGYRVANFQPGEPNLLYQYPTELMMASGINNYHLMGWLLFSLVGVASLIIVICIFLRVRYYPHLMIAESIFLNFFVLLHILFTGFDVIHLFLIPLGIAVLASGIRELMSYSNRADY